MKITGNAQVCASFGQPNKGNPGPAAYSRVLFDAGVDAVFVVLEPTDIGALVTALRDLGMRGGTVTKPFKQQILPHLDEIHDDVKAIGAANVVIEDAGRLRGYNSDWHGAMDALRTQIDLAGKKIALLGAGGAARAVAYGLSKTATATTVFNRTQATGEKVAEDFGMTYGGDLTAIQPEFDIIINATNIGMNDLKGQLPIGTDALANRPFVFDVIGKPESTLLLDVAAQQGCRTLSGLAMVAHQAVYALNWLTGAKVEAEDVLAELS